jgi:hypothetical protein
VSCEPTEMAPFLRVSGVKQQGTPRLPASPTPHPRTLYPGKRNWERLARATRRWG